MLLELAELLRGQFNSLHLFQYVTFRTIMSALTALVVALLLGPGSDPQARRRESRPGDPQRRSAVASVEGRHADDGRRADHPRRRDRDVAVERSAQPLHVDHARRDCVAFGIIGFYDDYKKLVLKDSRGLPARWKYFWQSVFGLAAAHRHFLRDARDARRRRSRCTCRCSSRSRFRSASIFVLLGYFIVVGFSNAVNLTDGLDGLAIMPTVLVASALGVFAYAGGQQRVLRRICRFPPCPARASCAFSAARWPARDSASSGSTRIRRRCSWATSARSRSARRSAASR